MEKNYIVDTNVLIQSPNALECFEDNFVIIPIVVIEELDSLKNAEGEKGVNARSAIRYLEKLRQKGNLIDGVTLENGGKIRIEKNYIDVKLPEDFPEHKSDNRILKVCVGLSQNNDKVVLVTKDILLRIKAQILSIQAEDFTTEQVASEYSQYEGRCEVFALEEAFGNFKKKSISLEDVYLMNEDGVKLPVDLVVNQFIVLKADQSNKKTQLGRYDGEKIVPLLYKKSRPYGVKPRNVGQYFLQEALMADPKEVPLVIVKGMAGTAKTFYSLAVGLEKVLNATKPEYRKILVSRPNAQFDDDIGFLPGTEQEKISPLMRPIIDNLEQLIDSNEEERYKDEKELKEKIEEVFDRGIVTAEAMNFIRGRSFVQTYLIIDEAQNMTPKQVTGIITRAGKGTKVILLGDPKQIDNPFLDERTNGLSYAAEHMKGSKLCYQIMLKAEECERSELALDAIVRL
ncbi:MAG: PhoH family protein [Lachnotalea sp.]